MAREMKNSGIEWIGEIPAKWEIRRNKTLFNCAKEIVGSASSKTQLLSLTTQGIKTKSKNALGGKVPESFDTYQIVNNSDIVMCLFDLDCSAVFSGISNYSGMISPAYKVVKSKEGLIPQFADYWFRFVFDGRKFKSYAKNLRYTLNYDEFAVLPFALPELNDQQKIVSLLDKKCSEIDAVIEKTKATIEEYKKLKQSVITEAVTKGIRGNRPMKDSDIDWVGKIPVEWNEIKLKYCTYIRARLGWKGLKADEYVDEGYPLLSAFNIINNKLDFSNVNYINQFRYDESPEIKLVIADILLVKDGAGIGKCAIVNDLPIPSTPNGSLAVITVSNYLTPKFLYYYFLSTMFQKYIDQIKDGMGVPHLFQSDLREIKVVYGNKTEQLEIVDYLDQKCAEIDALIEKKTNLLTELETYKKSLIYEYVTGKKEVGEVSDNTTVAIVYPCFPAVLSTNKARFAQAVLMSKILDSNVKHMGRVKLEKMLFTIEHSLGFNFDTEYVREMAGPLDGSIYECEKIVSRTNKWFYVNNSQNITSYKPQKNMGKYKRYYEQYFSDYNEEIESIISVFENYSLDQSEIVATLFAAWNDAIIDNKPFTDEDVVNDVLNNWHESKTRFSKDVWLRAMDGMRKNNLVPKGYGKKTVIKN